MKVLLIHGLHIPIGGADKVYFNTGDLLEQNGHSVIYFSYKNIKNVPCEQEKYFVDAPSKLKSVLHAFYNIQASKRIEALILDEKPDIAHLHSFWGGLTPSILKVLRRYNIPVVHTVHDYNMICPVTTSIDRNGNICESCQGKYFYKCVLKRCFKGSIVKSLILASALTFRRRFFDPVKLIDGFIFPSRFIYKKHLQYMPELGNSSSLLLYNFNPDTPSYTVNKYRRKYFLYLGRLSYEKGLATLIKAFSGLKDIHLIIVGTGPLENFLKSTVEKLDANNIEFAGFKSGNELHALVSDASFNVVPSEWWENNPMSVIESYSAGIPVIGTDVGGIPEIIEEGLTGYLFEMKNVEELARVVRKADLLSEEEYMAMSEQAVKYATDNFSKEQNVKQLVGFYEQMIQNKKCSI
jgi:glycosyltransferase involved in cell wall biosynthesis